MLKASWTRSAQGKPRPNAAPAKPDRPPVETRGDQIVKFIERFQTVAKDVAEPWIKQHEKSRPSSVTDAVIQASTPYGALAQIPGVEVRPVGEESVQWAEDAGKAAYDFSANDSGQLDPGKILGNLGGVYNSWNESAQGAYKENTKSGQPTARVAATSVAQRHGNLVREQQGEAAARDSRNMTGNYREGDALTAEEYATLTPRQRALVDFNTALVTAVKADRELSGGAPDAAYEESVKGMFGEDGGSKAYAPNTVRLLEEMGIDQVGTGDLDNFLQLKAGATIDEIRGLSEESATTLAGTELTPETDAATRRQVNAVQISEAAMQTLSETLMRGQNLLSVARGEEGRSEFMPTSQTGSDLAELFEYSVSGVLTDEEFQNAVWELGERGVDTTTVAQYLDSRLKQIDYLDPETGIDPATLLPPADYRARFFETGE